jgi:uncharacterized protein YjbI with pentapeptide repeats
MEKSVTTIRILLAVVASAILVGLIYVGYSYEWTGFGRSVVPLSENQDLQRAKTFWDWLQLLVVPLALGIGGIWLNRSQRRQELERQEAQRNRELDVEEQRRKRELEIENQHAQDTALQSYLDQIGELLLREELRTSEKDAEVRTLARARTSTILEVLDGPRRGTVLRFLYEAGLIKGEQPIIDLREANFIEARVGGVRTYKKYWGGNIANLSEINLNQTLLFEAELAGSILNKAYLGLARLDGANLLLARLDSADLSLASLNRADLSNTSLVKANLRNAQLRGAILKGSKLREADLGHASLNGADLTDADFSGANLEDSDLSGADLRLAIGLAQEQIDQALGTSQESDEDANTRLPDHLKAPESWSLSSKAQLDMRRAELDRERAALNKRREQMHRESDTSNSSEDTEEIGER